jgi:hypothetical protein
LRGGTGGGSAPLFAMPGSEQKGESADEDESE